MVVEDSAGLALNISPSTPIVDHFVSAWERAGRSVGWDPTYGCGLMDDLRTAGLLQLQGREYRQLGAGGESWAHLALGIQRLRGQLIEQGITGEHVTELLGRLADPENLIVGPPVRIAWGRRLRGRRYALP